MKRVGTADFEYAVAGKAKRKEFLTAEYAEYAEEVGKGRRREEFCNCRASS